MITFICWLWQPTGWQRNYSITHVNALTRMLRKHCTLPHRVVCVTDTPNRKGYECEVYPLWNDPKLRVKTLPGRPNCYQRLKLFDPNLDSFFGDNLVSIDLDTLIVENIDELFTHTEPFKIRRGRSAPYNGSIWNVRRGSETSHAWEEFSPATSPAIAAANIGENGKAYYGSDQAWISHILRGRPTWGPEDGILSYVGDVRRNGITPGAKIIFFEGDVKPWMHELKQHKRLDVKERYSEFL